MTAAPTASGATTGYTTAIATHGLAKAYGRVQALAGLDLEVGRGIVYGFLGPNGAGKTTTIRCLMGLIHPDAGSIDLFGSPFTPRDRRRLGRVGALIESPTFYPYLSGRDNLVVIGATGPAPAAGRVDAVLDLVGLRERAGDKVSGYSLGMRQRLGIAAALLNDPELLVLDEPANGLDPAGIVAMRETLRYLADQGKTVFVSSHILPEVQQLADVVGIINHGKLVRQGNLATLLAETGHVRVRVEPSQLAAARAALERLTGPGGVAEENGGATGTEGGWISVRVAPDQAAVVNRTLAEQGIFASGLESGNDLETLFLAMTGGA